MRAEGEVALLAFHTPIVHHSIMSAATLAAGAGNSWNETVTSVGKRYVVDLQPEFGCFRPTFIAISVGKTVAFKVRSCGTHAHLPALV